jgi:hypothetical protein
VDFNFFHQGEIGMLKCGRTALLTLIIIAGWSTHVFNGRGLAQTREARATQAAEVTVTLNEKFFNLLLDTIFARMKPPAFPLSITSIDSLKNDSAASQKANVEISAIADPQGKLIPQGCESVVVLEREAEGVKTAVRFENGRVVAPLAFKGSYSVALLGCINFRGWADTVINLEFNRERQVLSARVTVQDIHLTNIPSLASGVVVGLVQNSIDRRINPIEILRAAQLSARLPITGSDGALRLRATEIRPEVQPGRLSLHIFYEFTRAE